MPNIALCWELGAGAGHLKPLAEIAKAISSLEVPSTKLSLICRHADLVGNFREYDDVEVLQAPFAHTQDASINVINYSGLMTVCGYESSQQLMPTLKKWLAAFEKGEFDLIVADHSPTALLAARLLEIPVVMAGCGFSVPLASNPMPSLRPWERISQQLLLAADTHLLKIINSTLNQLGYSKKKLDQVKDLFDQADQWIMTHPKFDPYRRDGASYVDIDSVEFEEAEPVWPMADGDKIFCYFHRQSPHLPILLKQLIDLGRPSLVIVRGFSDEYRQQFLGSNVRLQSEFVNVAKVAAQCKTIICHGGQGVVKDFIGLGIPPIILPDVLERTLLAYRIGSQGLGFAGNPDASKIDIRVMLETAEQATKIWQNTQHFAAELSRADDLTVLQSLLISKFAEIGV